MFILGSFGNGQTYYQQRTMYSLEYSPTLTLILLVLLVLLPLIVLLGWMALKLWVAVIKFILWPFDLLWSVLKAGEHSESIDSGVNDDFSQIESSQEEHSESEGGLGEEELGVDGKAECEELREWDEGGQEWKLLSSNKVDVANNDLKLAELVEEYVKVKTRVNADGVIEAAEGKGLQGESEEFWGNGDVVGIEEDGGAVDGGVLSKTEGDE